jgi:hypothetical protein
MDVLAIFQTLYSLLVDLLTLAGQLFSLALSWSLLIVWTAWWLGAVDWPRLRDALRRGAWAPALLLLLVTAFAWSQIAASSCRCLGIPIGNFWWQLGAVGLLAAYTLFLGWLQGVFGWTPPTIHLDHPAAGHDVHHPGHGHHEPEPAPEQGHGGQHGHGAGHH